MSPDGIQGPPSPSPSSETLPACVGSQTTQDSASSIAEGCKLVVEEKYLSSVGGLGAPSCPEDEHHLRILHSSSPITPPLGSPSLDIPEVLPSSAQVMSDEVDSFHATPEKFEIGNSARVRHARQKFKTPSPPRTRRRYYDSLISPGKEALKADSTNTVFHRPNLDEIEKLTKANVSPVVSGPPSYCKPLAGPAEERSAIQCNLKMLIKTIKLHSTSTPTTTRSRSFSVQYVPQSMKSELMIESIFGSALDGTESKSESVSRVSPGPDAEPSDLRNEQPDVTPMLLDTFSLKRSSHNETNEGHQSNKLPPVNEQPQSSVLEPDTPPLATSPSSPDSTLFPQMTFKADLSNPLHQPGPPSPRTPKSNLSLLPAPNASVKRTPTSLSDPSFNPDFPLTLSPVIQRSVVFPLSPCSNIFQAQPSDIKQSNEHTSVAPTSRIAEPHAPDDEAASLAVAEPLSLSSLGDGALPAPGPTVPKGSQHIFIALGPLLASSLSSLPASKGPNKHVRYVRLQLKSPMASPIWNEVEALPLDADTEPPEVSFRRKRCPLVLESGYLHPRYRDLWASDASNDFLLHAKDHLKIAKVPILCTQKKDDMLVKDEEVEVDEVEFDELADDTEDVEVQDPASGVVFLSESYRDGSVASPSFVQKKKSRQGQLKSGLNLVVDATGKESRGSVSPYESASTRRPAKRSRTVSAQGLSPNKRHRALTRREVESEDESDRVDDAISSVKQNVIPKTRTQRWSSLLHSFLKGKRRLEQVDLHEITQALLEIKSDPHSIIPNSPLAGYIRTIANLQSSDIPDNDRLGWRPLAENILRFWGPETSTLKIAAGSGPASSSQPVVLSSSGQ